MKPIHEQSYGGSAEQQTERILCGEGGGGNLTGFTTTGRPYRICVKKASVQMKSYENVLLLN